MPLDNIAPKSGVKMTGYDFNRPLISEQALERFVAVNKDIASRYGKYVKAIELSNIEYKIRYGKLKGKNNMKPPPSCGRIFPGYLVIRKLGQSEQYETWMPDHVFEEFYKKYES